MLPASIAWCYVEIKHGRVAMLPFWSHRNHCGDAFLQILTTTERRSSRFPPVLLRLLVPLVWPRSFLLLIPLS
jgi:hypothetical protein